MALARVNGTCYRGRMMAEMTTLLGAYEVIRKTKTFPVPFWAVMQADDRILIETEDGVRWVETKELEKAITMGDVRLDGGE